eukprot:scaffold131668_cov23-Tisochrysis_lutea.AAC.4
MARLALIPEILEAIRGHQPTITASLKVRARRKWIGSMAVPAYMGSLLASQKGACELSIQGLQPIIVAGMSVRFRGHSRLPAFEASGQPEGWVLGAI